MSTAEPAGWCSPHPPKQLQHMELLRQHLWVPTLVPVASRPPELAHLSPVPRSSVAGSKQVEAILRRIFGEIPAVGALWALCGTPGRSECRGRCVASFSQHWGESPVEGLRRENWLCHLEQASKCRNKKLCSNPDASE